MTSVSIRSYVARIWYVDGYVWLATTIGNRDSVMSSAFSVWPDWRSAMQAAHRQADVAARQFQHMAHSESLRAFQNRWIGRDDLW